MIFEKVTLKWGNAEYVVEPNRVMMLIATVEDFITLQDLAGGKPAGSKVALAYAAALRYAGAQVANEEVYARFFGADDSAQVISDVVSSLLLLMIPPEHLRGDSEGGEAEGK